MKTKLWIILSRMEGAQAVNDEMEINDAFLNKEILASAMEKMPWYTDFANYAVREFIPENLSFHQSKKFLHNVTNYF